MIVFDSSALILLTKTGILDKTLQVAKSSIIIPAAVYEESTKKEELFDAQIIKQRVLEKKICVRQLKNTSFADKLKQDFNIGTGEAQAIALSIEIKGAVITDDKKAIRVCKLLNVQFTTAPNIVVRLRKCNIIDQEQARIVIENLQKYGHYSKQLMEKIKEELL